VESRERHSLEEGLAVLNTISAPLIRSVALPMYNATSINP